MADDLSEYNVAASWLDSMQEQFHQPYFTTSTPRGVVAQMWKLIENQRRMRKERLGVKGIGRGICPRAVYPPTDQVFSWTHYCEPKDVKVVILGQSPYDSSKLANGLAFSISEGETAPAPVAIMLVALEKYYPDRSIPDKLRAGDLSGWARQGVLLLNVAFTVQDGNSTSHLGLGQRRDLPALKEGGWERFTSSLLLWLSSNHTGIVFLLWGHEHAHKLSESIAKDRDHLTLMTSLPSPRWARAGFHKCEHFKKANEHLKGLGKTEVDWFSCD